MKYLATFILAVILIAALNVVTVSAQETPKLYKQMINSGNVTSTQYLKLKDEIAEDKAIEKMSVSTNNSNRAITAKLTAWNGHQFEVIEVFFRDVNFGRIESPRADGYRYYRFSPLYYEYGNELESYMTVFYPIDPSVTEAQVEGAVEAYANPTNTGWLFKHTEADYHHDVEDALWSNVVTRFHPVLSEILIKTVVAPNDVQRKTQQVTYESLLMYQSDVITAVMKEARSRHISYYHQNPLESYSRDPINRAFATVRTAWQNGDDSKITRFRTISGYITQIEASLVLHDYQHKHEMATEE